MKKRKMHGIIGMMFTLVLAFAMTTTALATTTVSAAQSADVKELNLIEQKIKDTADAYIIDADGSLTMTWKDVSGIENKITRLTGYWALGAGTFERGELFWGDTYTGPIDAPGSATVSKNFDKAVNYTSTSSTGKLRATSIAHIKSPKDGKRYQFSMSVVPTIFD